MKATSQLLTGGTWGLEIPVSVVHALSSKAEPLFLRGEGGQLLGRAEEVHFTTAIHNYLLMLRLRKEMLNPGIHGNTHRPRNPKPDPFWLSSCHYSVHRLQFSPFLALCHRLPSLLPFSSLPCSQIPWPAFTSPNNSHGILDPSLNSLAVLHPCPPASMRLFLSCPPHSLGTTKEKVRTQKS